MYIPSVIDSRSTHAPGDSSRPPVTRPCSDETGQNRASNTPCAHGKGWSSHLPPCTMGRHVLGTLAARASAARASTSGPPCSGSDIPSIGSCAASATAAASPACLLAVEVVTEPTREGSEMPKARSFSHPGVELSHQGSPAPPDLPLLALQARLECALPHTFEVVVQSRIGGTAVRVEPWCARPERRLVCVQSESTAASAHHRLRSLLRTRCDHTCQRISRCAQRPPGRSCGMSPSGRGRRGKLGSAACRSTARNRCDCPAPVSNRRTTVV